jgi:hypothetical protein
MSPVTVNCAIFLYSPLKLKITKAQSHTDYIIKLVIFGWGFYMNAALDIDYLENQPSLDDKFFFPGENILNDIHNVHPFDLFLAADANQEALGAAKLVIDKALIKSSENPGCMGSAEFAEAIKPTSTQAKEISYKSAYKTG